MSASFELTSLPGWAVVRSLLNDLKAQSALFEAFVARELGTLGAIRLALDQRQQEVERQQATVTAERLQLDEKWKQLETLRETVDRGAQRVQEDARRLATAQAELATVAGALDQQGGGSNVEFGRVSKKNLPANEQLTALREALRQAQSQISTLAGAGPELRTARREVDKLRRRLMRQNARLAQAKAQGEAQQSQQIQQIKEQRSRLLAELEASQTRAADLSAQVELQREQIAAERKSWLGELRRLRQVVQTQLRSSSDQPAGSQGASASANADESLDSILAQFETLQKELSQRVQTVVEIPSNS